MLLLYAFIHVRNYSYYREKILKVLLTKAKYKLLSVMDHVILFLMSKIC